MRFVVGLLALLLVSLLPFSAIFADDIPGNCEYTQSPEQLVLFPRYSQSTGRLVLVSWTTGEEVRTLAEGISFVSAVGWSADCRYLAIAEGTPEVMNTVVYDTQTSQRMGSVDDAHQQPHPITWGPNDYLVVETRNGGILWHVPTGMQVQLSDSYNTTTSRNFNRLRWDAANNQLIADLAVGGRAVYDLTTGEQVPVMAQAQPRPFAGPDALTVILGGAEYACSGDAVYRGGSNPPQGVFLDYDDQNNLLSLKLKGPSGGQPDTTLVTLEDNFDLARMDERGWSPSCQYFAVSILREGEETSETVVYDAVLGRRLGEVGDARGADHLLTWSTTRDVLLVETRHGAILWDLPTNTQTTITDAVETPNATSQRVRNVRATTWVGDELFATTADAPNVVTAFQTTTGDERVVAIFEWSVERLENIRGDWLAASFFIPPSAWRQTLFNVRDGRQLDISGTVARPDNFSPDGRYLILYRNRLVEVWSLQTGTQTWAYPSSLAGGAARFTDNVTYSWANGASVNVQTGEYTPPPASNGERVIVPITGEDGPGQLRWAGSSCSSQPEASVYYDSQQRALIVSRGGTETVLVSELNDTGPITWSPDCRVVYASVSQANDALPYDESAVGVNYGVGPVHTLSFWDAATGELRGEIPTPSIRKWSEPSVYWSPGSERALIKSSTGFFVFDPSTGTQTLLVYQYPTFLDRLIRSDPEIYWDFAHGQLFVTAWFGVLVFDLHSGQEIALLGPNPSTSSRGQCDFYGCSYQISEDGQRVYLDGWYALAQYDLGTLSVHAVDVDDTNSVANRPHATSPDGRYLIVAFNSFRVWDLVNLPESFNDRDPVLIFNGPDAHPETITFVDNVTLAATDYYGNTTYWNVETGEEVTLSPS